MSTNTILDVEALKKALQHGGAAGLADYITDDVEFTEVDQRTPPAAPPCTADAMRCSPWPKTSSVAASG